jgi:hypothetical protein
VISYLNKTIVPCAYICARGFANKEHFMHSTRIEKKKTTKENTQKTETQARAMLHDAIRPIYLQLDSAFCNKPMFARQTAKLI